MLIKSSFLDGRMCLGHNTIIIRWASGHRRVEVYLDILGVRGWGPARPRPGLLVRTRTPFI